jgi:hypothetical protein
MSQEFVIPRGGNGLPSVSCNWSRNLCGWDFAALQYPETTRQAEDADLAFEQRKERS